MAVINEEMKRKALEAYENKRDTFICFATGNTYPIKEDLKLYAFQWCDDGSKSWTLEYCSAWDRFLFERKVADGNWPGVILKFVPQPKDPVLDAAIDELNKSISEAKQ